MVKNIGEKINNRNCSRYQGVVTILGLMQMSHFMLDYVILQLYERWHAHLQYQILISMH